MTEPSDYLSPTILDSRRLFGPNLFDVQAGAVLDVRRRAPNDASALAAWSAQARRLAESLGWTNTRCVIRLSVGMASLFVSAPLDGLMTASDLTEHAWVAAEALASQSPSEDATSILREKYTRERQGLPHLVAIAQYAHERQLSFSLDDDACSVGSGIGVRLVMHSDVAVDDFSEFDESWETARDIPVVLVTGSNGKTTTTRLVAAMMRANGWACGWCCSDGVWVNGAQVEHGDYTGPAGARRVLCDTTIDAAVLETARGGMLRRGLALNLVHGAIITNIAADHFGEYGIETLADLAEVKAMVARALRLGAMLVLNADDPTLVTLSQTLEAPIAWFSVDAGASNEVIDRSAHSARVRDEHLWLRRDDAWHDLGRVREMPLTLNGSAVHNVANAAGAALLASVAGVSVAAIRATLATFGASPKDNPGRLMIRHVGGVTLVMDYAHNPEGMASLCRTAAALPADRRLLLLGQAGNRDDVQLRALAAAAWRTQAFDRVVVKEMPSMLRGRQPGEVSDILSEALRDAGAPPTLIARAGSEYAGVQDALSWARAGDLLVLGVHVERARVLALMDQLARDGWRAGETVRAEERTRT